MRYKVETIPAGLAGTNATVKRMEELVGASLYAQKLRLLVLALLDAYGVTGHEPLAAAKSLFCWVQQNVAYVNDPVDLETVQSPDVTLRLKAGDCDDHAILIAAMYMSIGLTARFVVIGPDNDHFQHVYTEVEIDGRWLSADTTRSVSFGAEVPVLGARKEFSLTKHRGLAMPTEISSVDAAKLERAVTETVIATLTNNWSAGKINRSDVVGYLRVIDEKNAPFEPDVWLKDVTRSAISAFLRTADARGYLSSKQTSLSGLEGLDGFLSSVWGAVKSVVKFVFGGGEYKGITVTLPSVQPPVASGSLVFENLLNNPIILVGGALVLYLLLRKS